MIRAFAALATLLALLVTGCSASQHGSHIFGTTEGPARPGQEGSYVYGTVPTGVIINFSINTLHNYSGKTVTLRSARLLSPSGAAVHVVNIRAYRIDQVGIGHLIGGQGDLAKSCGGNPFIPHPLTDVVLAPRSDSNWMIVIALIYKHPGKYPFGRIRINYVSNGLQDFQDYYVGDIRVTAVSNSRLIDPPDKCHRHHT